MAGKKQNHFSCLSFQTVFLSLFLSEEKKTMQKSVLKAMNAHFNFLINELK